MDVLTTILQACEAEQYIENFKNYDIKDAFTLKALSEEDLDVLVDDKDVRKKLLECISNLQLPVEKTELRDINPQYIILVINQVAEQLRRHSAILTTATNRNDIAICDYPLRPSIACLKNTLSSFEETLDDFEFKVLGKKKKRNLEYKKISLLLINSLAVASILMFCYCKFTKN